MDRMWPPNPLAPGGSEPDGLDATGRWNAAVPGLTRCGAKHSRGAGGLRVMSPGCHASRDTQDLTDRVLQLLGKEDLQQRWAGLSARSGQPRQL